MRREDTTGPLLRVQANLVNVPLQFRHPKLRAHTARRVERRHRRVLHQRDPVSGERQQGRLTRTLVTNRSPHTRLVAADTAEPIEQVEVVRPGDLPERSASRVASTVRRVRHTRREERRRLTLLVPVQVPRLEGNELLPLAPLRGDSVEDHTWPAVIVGTLAPGRVGAEPLRGVDSLPFRRAGHREHNTGIQLDTFGLHTRFHVVKQLGAASQSVTQPIRQRPPIGLHVPRDPRVTVHSAAHRLHRFLRCLDLDTRRDVHPVRLRHAPVDPRRKHIGVTLVPLREPQNPGVPQGHVSVPLNPHRHGHTVRVLHGPNVRPSERGRTARLLRGHVMPERDRSVIQPRHAVIRDRRGLPPGASHSTRDVPIALADRRDREP